MSLAILISLNTFATTWGELKVDDPIKPGSSCSVHEPISYGSYIYHWPSKYDQVFWPLIDPHGIWHCEDSGFIAFINDFEGLSSNEITKIRFFLESNSSEITTQIGKLRHLEQVYSLREKDKVFRNSFRRVLAFLYESEGKIDIANQYRSEALSEIKELLDSESLSEYQRLEYLYLAVNYELQLGNENSSKALLTALKTAIRDIKDQELIGFGEYLTTLLEDLQNMKAGGKLMPESESDA